MSRETQLPKTEKRDRRTGKYALLAETAAHVMSSDPVTVGPDLEVKAAIARMGDAGVGAVAVAGPDRRPLGVLSLSDVALACARFEASPPGKEAVVRVKDLMTPRVFSVRPEEPVEAVIRKLISRNVHRLFVVDREGILVGVISAIDLIRNLCP